MPFVLLNSAWQKQSQWVGERFGTLESEFVRINAGMNNLGARERNSYFLCIAFIQPAVEESVYYGPAPLLLHSTMRKQPNHPGEATLNQTLKRILFRVFGQKTPPKTTLLDGDNQTLIAFIYDDWKILLRQKG